MNRRVGKSSLFPDLDNWQRHVNSFTLRLLLLRVKHSLNTSDAEQETPEQPWRRASAVQAYQLNILHYKSPRSTPPLFHLLGTNSSSFLQSSASRLIYSPHVCNTCSWWRQFSTRCVSIQGAQTFDFLLWVLIPLRFMVLNGLPK
jgi:hypothetical protein